MLLNQKILTVATLATVALLGCSTPVHASPITYTLTTTASGTLGASSFTDALVTVTLTGDTANVTLGPGPFSSYLVNPGSGTVSIGLATATLTGSTEAITGTSSGQSFLLISQLDNPAGTSQTTILGQLLSLPYDLQSPLGPVSGTGGSSAPDPLAIFFTTAGNLNFTAPSFFVGTTTFTAVTATPEPSTLGFIGTGFLIVVGSHFWRRRFTFTSTNAVEAS